MFSPGDKKIDTVYLNTQNFESLMRELLLVKQYRVSVWKQQTASKNDWAEEYKVKIAIFDDSNNLVNFID